MSSTKPSNKPGNRRKAKASDTPGSAEFVPSGVATEEELPSLSLFDNIADDTYLMVWRRDPTTKRMVYMGRLARDEGSEEVLKERVGGGVYQVREKITTAEGQQVWGRSRTFTIGGPPKLQGNLDTPSGATLGAAAPTVAAAPGMAPAPGGDPLANAITAQVISMMERNNQMMAQQAAAQGNIQQMYMSLFERLSKPQEGGGLLGQVLPLLAPLVPLMVEFLKGRRDPMEVGKEIAALVSEKNGKQSELKDVLGMVKDIVQLRETVRESLGDDDEPRRGGNPLLDSIPQLIQIMGEDLQMRKRGGVPRPTVPRPGPRPGTVPPSQPAAPAGETETAVGYIPEGSQPRNADPRPLWQQVLGQEHDRILMFASSNQDPEFCAEMAVRFIPADLEGVWVEFVQDPDHVAKVLDFMPELKQFPKWTEKFFAVAKELLLDEDDEDDDDPITQAERARTNLN